MEIIQSCEAKKIKDSRGEETLEVEIKTDNFFARASLPSGKSLGSKEAVALPAIDAIRNVNEIIAPQLFGRKISLFEIDRWLLELDGTLNKANLGANALLGVSVAILKLEAKIAGRPLWQYIQSLGTPSAKDSGDNSVKFPRLFANVLNGGAHADFRLPFQEYLFVLGNGLNVAGPVKQLKILFEQLLKKLTENGEEVAMGDEGGFSFASNDLEKPFQILSELHHQLAVDVAGNELFNADGYHLLGKTYSTEELLKTYEDLTKKFPIVSWEDPFAENDLEGFKKMTEKMNHLGVGHPSGGGLVVGDDLTVTNSEEIRKAISGSLINTVLIKPNQIGTVTETFQAIKTARDAGFEIIISHRSGETQDAFIADLAVGVGAYGIKAGAPSQSERMAKYERLEEIEKEVSIR